MSKTTKNFIQEVTPLGVDKVARYGWKIISEEGDLTRVHKRLLHVNNDIYQREASRQKVSELAREWSWIACGVLTVARRKGVLWVVDGQHRKLAADRRSDIQELPCIVFDVEAVKDEALAFLATNTNRKPVTALAKFKAQLAADDPAAILVQATLSDCGLRLATASQAPGDFKAVAWAMTEATADPDAFILVMQLAAELAMAEATPVHHQIVKGLRYIHANVEGGLDSAGLRKRLVRVGMTKLHRAVLSASEYYAGGGAKVYADGMMQAANKGLQNKFVFRS